MRVPVGKGRERGPLEGNGGAGNRSSHGSAVGVIDVGHEERHLLRYGPHYKSEAQLVVVVHYEDRSIAVTTTPTLTTTTILCYAW